MIPPTKEIQLESKLSYQHQTWRSLHYPKLSQFMQDRRDTHLKSSFLLLRYLKQDPTLGVYLSYDPGCTVQAFCDYDWAHVQTQEGQLHGYLILLGNNPINCKSKKTEIVSLSSDEEKYRSRRKIVGELTWLNRLLNELTIMDQSPIFVYCDSQFVIHSS